MPIASENAVLTLSLGHRPFVTYTRPLMAAYAERVGADFHCVDSREHPALDTKGGSWPSVRAVPLGANITIDSLRSRLRQQVGNAFPQIAAPRTLWRATRSTSTAAFIGPSMPNLFALVPATALRATVEEHKPQAWHSMHWRNACELYGVTPCVSKKWKLFNGGALLSSAAHGQMIRTAGGWTRRSCSAACCVTSST